MCDRDRLCASGDDRPSCLRVLATSANEDDDDHGYHTPKNIFNAEMSRLSQMQLSHGQQAAKPNHANESDAEDEENPYSTIKKCPLRSTMLKNLETLIEKNAADKVTTPQNTRSIFYNDATMDHMIRDLEHAATLKKKLPWLDRIGDIDRVDIALLISFILLVIFGFSGFYILVNEF